MTGVAGRRFGGHCSGWRGLFRTMVFVAGLLPMFSTTQALERRAATESISEVKAAIRTAEVEQHALEKQVQHLDQRMSIIERRAQIHVLGHEFAESLVGELLALPDPADFRHSQDVRALLLQRTSGAQLRVEREINDLAEKDQRQWSPSSGGRSAVPAEDIQRYHDLAELSHLQTRLIDTLRESDRVTTQLLHASKKAEARLKQLLFWIPAPVGASSWEGVLPSLAWMVSADNWRTAAGIACKECRRDPWRSGSGLLVVVLLVLGHRPMRDRLFALVERGRVVGYVRKRELLQALLITAALPAALPLAMLVTGSLVDAAPGLESFAASLGDALLAMSSLVYAIGLLIWFVDPRGVAAAAGRDQDCLVFLSRTLRCFMPGFVLVLFVAALNGLDDAPFSNRESLGRLAFVAAMLMLAWLFGRLFQRRSPLISRLSELASRGWIIQFRPFWLLILIALPLVFAGFAIGGYFVAAEYFFGRLAASFFVLLGAVMMRDFLCWWLTAAGNRSDLAISAMSVAAVDEEKRSLINLALMVFVLVGLWVIWRSGLPVLAAIGNYPLYSYASTVNGAKVVHALTLEGFAIGIIVALVTWVIVRNIGGFLDVALLRRIDMQADASFAIKVVSRYIIIIGGVVVASSALGLGWDDVQWLVAALSVGIGFGLQEIFGNLVAGLMMLAERPVRIGDIVTVGDVTGTVSKIQARATTVTDFDNKEILIPNKSFITDRVINWTLSNQTTRLLIKVSVPRGTDVGHAQQVLLDVVRANRDVSMEIPPAVLCLGLVDRTLEFEVSAFVDSFDKRRRVQHELNGAIDLALRENGIVG